MSRKHVTGSLLIANTMSPCSNRFSASDPAKHPFTRKTCRLIGSFLTRAYEMSLPSLNYKSEVKLNSEHYLSIEFTAIIQLLLRVYFAQNKILTRNEISRPIWVTIYHHSLANQDLLQKI